MEHRILLSIVIVVLIVGLSGCETFRGQGDDDGPSQAVSLSDLPEPARATVEKLTAGGEITRIDKEGQGSKAVYDVEARVQGKEVEYDVAADGTVLSSEESVPYASLPAAVQTSAAKYFGSSEGLAAHREIEKGKTYYEVEGNKGRTAITLKLTDTGKIIEKERE